MSSFLLDTHVWAWSLTGDKRLSPRAVAVMEKAEHIFVSPISLFEIGQKVRLGNWPEMEPFVEELPALLQQQGGEIADLTPAICVNASMMKWGHRDPFDRLLAATAMDSRIAIISADVVFDALDDLGDWIARIW